VIISGGGIGGLTCAVALSKYPDIDVDVYEAGPSFTQNGPGCGAWLRTWNILQKLGLDRDLAKIAGTQPTHDPGSSSPLHGVVSLTMHISFHIQLS
jgi:salicylate hydroxylase